MNEVISHLSKILEIDNSNLIKECLKETAQVHHRGILEVGEILLGELSARESAKEFSFRRARELLLSRYERQLKSAKTLQEKARIFSEIVDNLKNPEFYREKWAKKIAKIVISNFLNPAVPLVLSEIMFNRDAPIKDVLEVLFPEDYNLKGSRELGVLRLKRMLKELQSGDLLLTNKEYKMQAIVNKLLEKGRQTELQNVEFM